MRTILCLAALLAACASSAAPRLQLVNTLATGNESTEIVAVHAASARAFVTSSADGLVDVYSLSDPRQPRRTGRIRLRMAAGDDLTGLAVHPSGEYLLLSIEAREPARGRVEFRATADGRLLGQVTVGVGPDAVAVSPDGRWALVCDEAEQFFLDPVARRFASAPGSLHVIALGAGPEAAEARRIDLPDLTGTPGIVDAKAKRTLERLVDLDLDGRSNERVDLNGDGDAEDEGVVIGTLGGIEVKADEGDGEELQLPLAGATPDLLEPEYAVFRPDSRSAWVVLQENNALLLVDVVEGRVVRTLGLGTTAHAADLADDDRAEFGSMLMAWREPDGIALTPDGRYLLTADEGDTDPKASKTKAGLAAGGGRTLSVFDADTGVLLGDTGAGLDQAAAAARTYPDARSPNKGSEPEMVVAFDHHGTNYAAVSLERANAVALVSLADPTRPSVVQVAGIDLSAKAGKVAPEGIAQLRTADGRQFLYTANERNGTLAVFEVSGH